jgi:hypothetical protein
MKRTLRSIICHGTVLAVMALPILVLAAQGSGGSTVSVSGTLENPLEGTSDISGLLDKLLSVFLQVGLVVVVVAFVYVGYKFVMARGSEKEVTDAKKAFYWTVIGAAVLLGAKVIQTAILGTVKQLGVS